MYTFVLVLAACEVDEWWIEDSNPFVKIGSRTFQVRTTLQFGYWSQKVLRQTDVLWGEILELRPHFYALICVMGHLKSHIIERCMVPRRSLLPN